jgi:hypothetical protein
VLDMDDCDIVVIMGEYIDVFRYRPGSSVFIFIFIFIFNRGQQPSKGVRERKG